MAKAKLLWIDLEMTGLEPDKDKILEGRCGADQLASIRQMSGQVSRG